MSSLICIKCGLEKTSQEDPFICDDCKSFSKVVISLYEDINNSFNSLNDIDPELNSEYKLLADITFVTGYNPQINIFYKLSEFLVARSMEGIREITEDELNKEIRTTRSWHDAFQVFEELNLIDIRIDEYRRILIIKDKLRNFAKQYFDNQPLSEQVKKRLAQIYAGFIILYIMKLVAELENEEDIIKLPYKQRPKTIWTVLMFLWLTAYRKENKFSEEELRKFFSKRKIPSNTRGRIIRSLQAIDGKFSQGLIKKMEFENGNLEFEFEDYIMIEMERIREMVRDRYV